MKTLIFIQFWDFSQLIFRFLIIPHESTSF